MNTERKLIFAILAIAGCVAFFIMAGVGATKVIREILQVEARTITLTNYVTIKSQPEFGPDGYGCRHLAKEESELVRDCLRKMEKSSPWERPTLFEDLSVIKTVTYTAMPTDEILRILSTQANVANVSYRIGAKRSVFSLDTLAYPQYENDYRLTAEQWKSLQDYCRLQLIDPIATASVVEHWRSITNGVVPFGLVAGK